MALLALGLALMPRPVRAGPAPVGPAEATAPASPTSPAETADETAPTDGTVDEGREGEAVDAGEAGPAGDNDPATEADDDGAEASGQDEAADAPDTAADADANADDATADDDAPGALGPTAAPLRPLQTAAWWTMFGAFAVGTTAGVLAGLAERQEDRATRLSTLFDAETGAQPRYVDHRDEYEQYLRRGEGYAKAAIGVGVLAGVATVAAITLFAVDARRQRGDAAPKERRRAALRVRGGGVEVRF